MKHLNSATLLIAALALSSCSRSDRSVDTIPAIRGSGILDSVELATIPSFSELDFAAAGTVTISTGSSDYFKIRVDNNILPYVTHQVANDRLTFGIQDDINAVDYDLTIDLTVSDLRSVTLSGAGSITTLDPLTSSQVEAILAGSGTVETDVQCDQLISIMAGQGSLILGGSARNHNLLMSGSGSVQAYGLAADTAEVVLSGQGDIQANVTDRLEVVLSGIGNVYFHGHPTLVATVTGVGRVIDAN